MLLAIGQSILDTNTTRCVQTDRETKMVNQDHAVSTLTGDKNVQLIISAEHTECCQSHEIQRSDHAGVRICNSSKHLGLRTCQAWVLNWARILQYIGRRTVQLKQKRSRYDAPERLSYFWKYNLDATLDDGRGRYIGEGTSRVGDQRTFYRHAGMSAPNVGLRTSCNRYS